MDAKDQVTSVAPELDRDGFSVWATPRTLFGLEALLRYDELVTNKNASPKPKKKRSVFGIAYWPPLLGGKTISFLADYSRGEVQQHGARSREDEDLRGPHALQLLINAEFTRI